jgi:hypothetical protein
MRQDSSQKSGDVDLIPMVNEIYVLWKTKCKISRTQEARHREDGDSKPGCFQSSKTEFLALGGQHEQIHPRQVPKDFSVRKTATEGQPMAEA